MSYLPIYIPPYKDELMYSWIGRLARANSLSLAEFSHAYCGMPKYQSVCADMRRGFFSLSRSLPFTDELDDLYLEHTTIGLEMIAKPVPVQTQYFNMSFQPYSHFNIDQADSILRVKVCPECIKEDRIEVGQPYIHCSHQLGGVDVCYKHHVPLMTYHGKMDGEMDFNLDDYDEEEILIFKRDAIAYADCVHELQGAGLHTDSDSVRETILKKLEEDGFDTTDPVRLFSSCFDDWTYNSLTIMHDYEGFFRVKPNVVQSFNLQTIVPVLMYLWPDPNGFADAASDHEPYLKQYTCSTCGRTYYETPRSQRDGWGCPYCAEHISDEERFEHLVDVIGNGEYEVITPFKSMGKKVRMKHIPCGHEFEVTPTGFLFRDRRCPCFIHENVERQK